MMKMVSILVALVAFGCNGFAQFYYNDILGTKLANENYQLIKKLKPKKIAAVSYDENNVPIPGLVLNKELSKNLQQITTSIEANENNATTNVTFYAQDKINKSVDEGKKINTTIEYFYDATNKLSAILTSAIDTAIDYAFTEEHKFVYGKKGLPLQMLKIKDSNDTTLVNFVEDENGNIGEERWIRNGRVVENYYYYYDKQNRLTDIVRYNFKTEKLLPEFIFEYNEQGQLYKTTKIPYGSSNYSFWIQQYLPNGLLAKELRYDRFNQLQGKMEYSYDY